MATRRGHRSPASVCNHLPDSHPAVSIPLFSPTPSSSFSLRFKRFCTICWLSLDSVALREVRSRAQVPLCLGAPRLLASRRCFGLKSFSTLASVGRCFRSRPTVTVSRDAESSSCLKTLLNRGVPQSREKLSCLRAGSCLIQLADLSGR